MSYPEHRGARAGQAAVRAINAVITSQQITISDVSKAAGIPRSTLHHRLHGKGDITVSELVRLAVALQVPVADLLAEAAAAASADGDRTHE